jgi:hypothetical protein
MNFSMISERLGFDKVAVDRLTDGEQRRLAVEVVLAFISCLLFGLSAAYLAYIEAYDNKYAWMIATGVGIGIFLFALNIQRLFVTTGGFGMSRQRRDIGKWRPDQLRLFLTFLLAVLFSQPLLLFLFHSSLSEKVRALTDDQLASFRQAELTHIDSKLGPLIMRQQRNAEKLAQMGIPIAKPAPASTTVPASASTTASASSPQKAETPLAGKQQAQPPQKAEPSRAASSPAKLNAHRKALVIGVQAYRYVTPLGSPVKDAQDMAAALKRMGYQVTLVRDPNTRSADIFRAIDSYIKSIRPGDISVFYFSGHGFQAGGSNYLAPQDMSPQNPRAAMPIGLKSVLEEIGSRSPRASIFLIDACSSWGDSYHGGMVGVNAEVDNYYAVLAATPGQSAIDLGAGQNSLYTKILLTQLEKPIPFNDVVSLTGAGVRKLASSVRARQQPIGYGLIDEAGFSLVDRSASPGSVTAAANNSVTPAKARAAAGAPAAQAALPVKPSTAATYADPCRVGERYDAPCLLADHELTALRLARLSAERGENLEKAVNEQREFLLRSGHLEDRFRMQWSSALTSLALTILLTALLWMGDVARDGNPVVLRAYERERYDMARSFVKENHEKYGQKVHEALSAYPHDPRERLPVWDHDKDFFHEEPIRRPDHREQRAELRPDSVMDLLYDMGHPAGARA